MSIGILACHSHRSEQASGRRRRVERRRRRPSGLVDEVVADHHEPGDVRRLTFVHELRQQAVDLRACRGIRQDVPGEIDLPGVRLRVGLRVRRDERDRGGWLEGLVDRSTLLVCVDRDRPDAVEPVGKHDPARDGESEIDVENVGRPAAGVGDAVDGQKGAAGGHELDRACHRNRHGSCSSDRRPVAAGSRFQSNSRVPQRYRGALEWSAVASPLMTAPVGRYGR